MLSQNNKITARQLQILLFLNIFGIGVIALPRIVAEQAGTAYGWICVVLATCIVLLAAFFMCYAGEHLTKPVGAVLSVFFIVRLIAGCAMEARIFGEIVRLSMLPLTPVSLICGVLLLTAAYAVSKGYETRARVGEILVFTSILPLLIICGMLFSKTNNLNFYELLPTESTAPKNIFMGTAAAVFAFKGVELVLLAFPYLKDSDKRHRTAGIVRTIAIIGLLMAGMTIITTARFGEHTARLMYPTLEMLDTAEIAGAVNIERKDALVMCFWIVSTFSLISAFLFFSVELTANFAGGKNRKKILLALLALSFVIAVLPRGIGEAYKINDIINITLGAPLLFVLPVVLAVKAFLKRRKNGKIT